MDNILRNFVRQGEAEDNYYETIGINRKNKY